MGLYNNKGPTPGDAPRRRRRSCCGSRGLQDSAEMADSVMFLTCGPKTHG